MLDSRVLGRKTFAIARSLLCCRADARILRGVSPHPKRVVWKPLQKKFFVLLTESYRITGLLFWA
jgi:hypothetical protein